MTTIQEFNQIDGRISSLYHAAALKMGLSDSEFRILYTLAVNAPGYLQSALREATGIDLPGEVRRSEYYTADRMGPVELASCSFGQSSKVSYLQMLTAVCAVVNGGELMQPYVVAKITAPDGTVVKEVQPTVKRRVISAETSATMCRLMEGVVTGGTGKQAALAGYRIGGKSGTSQKLDSANEGARIASFVSVAPIDDPKVAVLVCLDEPHSWTTSGGALSGPVCAEVLGKVLPYLGVERESGE